MEYSYPLLLLLWRLSDPRILGLCERHTRDVDLMPTVCDAVSALKQHRPSASKHNHDVMMLSCNFLFDLAIGIYNVFYTHNIPNLSHKKHKHTTYINNKHTLRNKEISRSH